MSLTIVQQPSEVQGINGRTIIVASSTNVSEPKFRFRFVILVESTSFGPYYIEADPNDLGVFDCSPRLKELVQADLVYGTSPATMKHIFDNEVDMTFMLGQSSMKDVDVFVRESFAVDLDSEPIDQGTIETISFKMTPESHRIKEGINPIVSRGVLTGQVKEGLVICTNARYAQSTILTVNLAPAARYIIPYFTNGLLESDVSYWKMTVIFADASTQTSDIEPSTSTFNLASGTPEIVYFLCGPRDLHAFTGIPLAMRPTTASTWKSYKLVAYNALDEPISATYTIVRNERSCRYDHYQLMFTNRVGFWNLQSFYMTSKRTVKVAGGGKEYVKNVGSTTDGDGLLYGFKTWDREVFTYGKEPEVMMELNSDWLNAAEAADMDSYIYSNDAWLLKGGIAEPIPVTITNQSHNDDEYKNMRQYKVSIEVAQRYFTL